MTFPARPSNCLQLVILAILLTTTLARIFFYQTKVLTCQLFPCLFHAWLISGTRWWSPFTFITSLFSGILYLFKVLQVGIWISLSWEYMLCTKSFMYICQILSVFILVYWKMSLVWLGLVTMVILHSCFIFVKTFDLIAYLEKHLFSHMRDLIMVH
jgi:hypothetical protein